MTKPAASAPPAELIDIALDMRVALGAGRYPPLPVSNVKLAEWIKRLEALAASAQVREVEASAVCLRCEGDEERHCPDCKPASEPAPVAQGDDEAWNDPALRAILRQSIEREFADHARIVAALESKLAECFRLAGGDTECSPVAQQAARAVSVVVDLRECYEERGDELTATEASLAACRAESDQGAAALTMLREMRNWRHVILYTPDSDLARIDIALRQEAT